MVADKSLTEIRHIERTLLEPEPLREIINRYCRLLEYKFVISFDKQIKHFDALYLFDNFSKAHYIRISIWKLKGLSQRDQQYEAISLLLHELCHAMQQELMGERYHSKSFACAKDVEDEHIRYYYADREIEARIFADRSIKEAIGIYLSHARTTISNCNSN